MFFVPHYGTDLTDPGATMDQWHDRDGNSLGTDFPQDWRNTAGATFDITGVQIEVAQQGQTRPTPFEHIPYDLSLQRCQRYLYRVQGDSGDGRVIGVGLARDNDDIRCVVPMPTTMRVNEGTVTESGLDCMYRTSNTDVSMTSSQNEGKNAVP